MHPVVRFEGVSVFLGGRPILTKVDLEVGVGKVVGVAGPNGSGKTTLVRTAATLLTPESGVVHVVGSTHPGEDARSSRRRIGFMGHQPALIPELTLHENLAHLARLRGIDVTRVARALDVVGLGEVSSRRANASSFGMKRRVEIAYLLLSKPDLLLLDEAASGLDREARELIDVILESVTDRGGGALVVSHDADQLARWCHDVATIDAGRVEAPS